MKHYIAVIHKEPGTAFGVSFTDVPGVIASAETLHMALQEAREALSFAAEDWDALTGAPFPPPRTLDALRGDNNFQERAAGAIVAAVPLAPDIGQAA